MTRIRISGWGAVSPAGWGMEPLRAVCEANTPCPTSTIEWPGESTVLTVRRVPRPASRPGFLSHPRLRRSSPISSHTAAASLEALAPHLEAIQTGATRLGIVFTALTGCVSYSRRFYTEVLADPSTASPIVFPETVFNAPASHLATYLNTRAINYTLIGDPGTFLQGLALAAHWLVEDQVDQCLVVGAEELDRLVAAAQHLFHPRVIVSEGAGALVLERATDAGDCVMLDAITQPALYTRRTPPATAARQVREALGAELAQAVLIDSLTGVPRVDRAESTAWADWAGARLSLKPMLGESFAAASAWQCVLAADRVARGLSPRAIVNVVGCNQQAIAARFSAHPGSPAIAERSHRPAHRTAQS